MRLGREVSELLFCVLPPHTDSLPPNSGTPIHRHMLLPKHTCTPTQRHGFLVTETCLSITTVTPVPKYVHTNTKTQAPAFTSMQIHLPLLSHTYTPTETHMPCYYTCTPTETHKSLPPHTHADTQDTGPCPHTHAHSHRHIGF